MLKAIIDAGINDEQPENLQMRVRLSNIVILVLFFTAALPFTIISILYFPKLTYIPVLGGIACMVVFFMNYVGLINLSRVLIALVAIFAASSFNYIICGADDPPIPSLFLMQMSFSLLIFILFDLKERQFIFPLLIVAVVSIIGFPIFKNWYTIEYDQIVLREGWLSVATSFLAVLSGQLSVFSLAYLNWRSEKKSADMIDDIEKTNKSLLLSEKQMRENFLLLDKAKEDERKRNWATEGLGKIAEVLRNSSGDDLFDMLVSDIVKYLKVNQGGLFITEENEEGTTSKTKEKLTLKACYAYSRKKYEEKTFLPGQGLVGQAYLEKSHIHLTEVPQNYVRITSGLGDATPNAIIVLPLLLNDVVEGVLELASFRKFEPHEIEFLVKACENMASYIHNDRINSQTKKLLEESMNNSEEMRAQEEELRQNHEELMATQEEMRRQNEELIQMKENLEAEIRQLHQQLKMTDKEIVDRAIDEVREVDVSENAFKNDGMINKN